MQRISDPGEILRDHGPIEAIAHPERGERIGVRRRSRSRKIGGVAGDEITRRQLDDREGDDAHREEGRYHPQDASQDQTQHASSPSYLTPPSTTAPKSSLGAGQRVVSGMHRQLRLGRRSLTDRRLDRSRITAADRSRYCSVLLATGVG